MPKLGAKYETMTKIGQKSLEQYKIGQKAIPMAKKARQHSQEALDLLKKIKF